LRIKPLQILIHIVAWVLFISLLTTLVPSPQKMDRFIAILVPSIFFIAYYYINYFIFVPELFIEKKYFLFGFVSILFLILTITVPSMISGSSWMRPEMPEFMNTHGMNPSSSFQDINSPVSLFPEDMKPPEWRFFFKPEFSYTIIVFLFLLTLSTGIRVIMQWQLTEKEKVNAELSFLKAQINPHFLFNTLNNIYSMAVASNEQTASAIGKFSEMMRFVIYETDHDFIPLEKNIDYINSYIELQKLRLSSNTIINYKTSGSPDPLMIAPLILMPFIENAFKFGVSTEKESFIDIKIDIGNNFIDFSVYNTKSGKEVKENNSSQLGIKNTLKRLQLIYPGKHSIDITDEPDRFLVTLKLILK
jgi:sensor histidine kinase YesM